MSEGVEPLCPPLQCSINQSINQSVILIQELEYSTSKQFLIIHTSASSSLNFGTIVVNYFLIRPLLRVRVCPYYTGMHFFGIYQQLVVPFVVSSMSCGWCCKLIF